MCKVSLVVFQCTPKVFVQLTGEIEREDSSLARGISCMNLSELESHFRINIRPSLSSLVTSTRSSWAEAASAAPEIVADGTSCSWIGCAVVFCQLKQHLGVQEGRWSNAEGEASHPEFGQNTVLSLHLEPMVILFSFLQPNFSEHFGNVSRNADVVTSNTTPCMGR